MTSTTKILSYAAIIEYMEVHRRATAQKLKDRLREKELPNSEATFERLKSDLQQFGIYLNYENREYRMEKKDHPHQSVFFHLINLVREVHVFENFMLDAETRNKIVLESKEPPIFYIHITPIFRAISTRQTIRFDYHHFQHGHLTNLELNPYLLTEFKGRWYVIGYSQYTGENRTFALDRMSNLEVLNVKFQFDGHADIAQKVSETIGVNYSGDPIRLVLKAHHPQNEYLRNLCLHDSQQEIEQGVGFTIFEYRIRPNFELEQELMKLSDQISIMEPEWLRNTIVKRLQEAIVKNNNSN